MSTEERAAVGSVPRERPPLDDLMLAMDVVDTLRRRDRLVARELDEEGRAEDLTARLKRIYAQQGIDVSDRVIEQGVAALREDRFAYKPAQPGWPRTLAVVYVRRGRWGKWLGGGMLAVLLAAVVNYFAFVAPDKALPDDLEQRRATVLAIAASDEGRNLVEQLFEAGGAALRNADPAGARLAIAQLDELADVLAQEYLIQIVNRPGERSGVWRIPDLNQQARNYYVIVEALDSTGRRLRVPIRNEENGETEQVVVWGLRVDEATFEAVTRDKQDDGIIENDRFGYKSRGQLQPRYDMPTSGGAITRW